MKRRHPAALLCFLGLFLAPAALSWRGSGVPVEGRVLDGERPVPGARVRWQGDARCVVSGSDGAFRLPARRTGQVTAWKPGYRIGAASPDRRPIELRLERPPAEDNPDYTWLSPHLDARSSTACGNCHAEIYREWNGSAHAGAVRNPRFVQLFSDPDGKSPPGWDLSREHPLGLGVCASCHAPTLDAPGRADDYRQAKGVAADGIHCDYCHKIVDAPVDKLGVRFGRDGLALLRPKNGDQLFFGPLEDAVRPGESFGHLPLYKESRICASCHEGIVFGVHVYGTYSEWLESPAGKQGVHCQSCHLAPTGRLTNIATGHGGIERDPRALGSHRFAGSQADMLRRCLELEASCKLQVDKLQVDVTVRADHVGHRVPTGFIDRHLLLVVQAFDASRKSLRLLDGPRLPPAAGDFGGQAGVLYGTLRPEQKTGDPLPFWIPGAELVDTRLHPGRPDHRTFTFPADTDRVEVRLWYRRFWHTVAKARGWSDNDTVVQELSIRP